MSRGKNDNLFFTSEFALLYDRWTRTKDNETLAQLVELSPPGGLSDLGKAIASDLRNKRPNSKADEFVKWREIDRLFRYYTVENGKTHEDAYKSIRQIYFSDKGEDRYDLKSIERMHQRWSRKLNL